MAGAGRHPRRLHGHPVAACATSCSRAMTWTERSEHAAVPARVRAGGHLPVRPALRVQRVLQVLQERREHRVQVHPGRAPHVLRRVHQPRHRHHHDQPGGVRGDATVVRRRLAARPLPERRGSRWTGSSTRSRRRPTARSSATSRSCGSRSTSIAPGTRRAGAGTGPGIDHPLARTPVFLLGDSAIGSPYFQSISLGLECAFFLAGHIANRDLSVGGDVRPLRGVHVPAVAARLHAHPDDQAQQGPVSPVGTTPHLFEGDWLLVFKYEVRRPQRCLGSCRSPGFHR